MREIKFRAWDGFKMIEYFYLRNDGQIFLDNDPRGVDMSGKISIYPPNYNRYKIMQYTGFKDKNRKEIYKGDIVGCYMGRGANDILEVVYGGRWNYAAFGLQAKRKNPEPWEKGMTWDVLNKELAAECEILGKVEKSSPDLTAGEFNRSE